MKTQKEIINAFALVAWILVAVFTVIILSILLSIVDGTMKDDFVGLIISTILIIAVAWALIVNYNLSNNVQPRPKILPGIEYLLVRLPVNLNGEKPEATILQFKEPKTARVLIRVFDEVVFFENPQKDDEGRLYIALNNGFGDVVLKKIEASLA